jgi:hypothetical protein
VKGKDRGHAKKWWKSLYMIVLNVALNLKSQKIQMFVQQWLSIARIATIAIRRNSLMGMLFAALGRIAPITAFQTTDGRKFVGEGAREKAEDHQRWLNTQQHTQPEEGPLGKLLKKLKRKRRKPL